MAEIQVTKRIVEVRPSNAETIINTDKIIQVGVGDLEPIPIPDSKKAVTSEGIVKYVEEKVKERVPFRLRNLNPLPTTAGFRSRSQVHLYADAEETGESRVSLQDIKNLNTKILNADNESSIDYALIDSGDYIMIKEE